jgi:hypothetical protein
MRVLDGIGLDRSFDVAAADAEGYEVVFLSLVRNLICYFCF